MKAVLLIVAMLSIVSAAFATDRSTLICRQAADSKAAPFLAITYDIFSDGHKDVTLNDGSGVGWGDILFQVKSERNSDWTSLSGVIWTTYKDVPDTTSQQIHVRFSKNDQRLEEWKREFSIDIPAEGLTYNCKTYKY